MSFGTGAMVEAAYLGVHAERPHVSAWLELRVALGVALDTIRLVLVSAGSRDDAVVGEVFQVRACGVDVGHEDAPAFHAGLIEDGIDDRGLNSSSKLDEGHSDMLNSCVNLSKHCQRQKDK